MEQTSQQPQQQVHTNAYLYKTQSNGYPEWQTINTDEYIPQIPWHKQLFLDFIKHPRIIVTVCMQHIIQILM